MGDSVLCETTWDSIVGLFLAYETISNIFP